MQYRALRSVLMTVCFFLSLHEVYTQPEEPLPAILGGIGNVATSATNFLTSAVDKPRKLLINATRATTGIIDSAASKGLEFKLRRFLEKFRGRMRYGIPELDIPPLEPLELDEIDIDIDNPDIGNVTLVIEDLVVHNLSTFVINKAKLSLIGPTITANVSVPHVFIEGVYNISGILGNMVHLHGAGPFQADIYDFQLYVNTILGYYRGVYLKTFDLDFNLSSMDVRLENFMGDEEISRIMSKVFQELSPKALDIIKPDILPGIQSYIAGRVNDTIHHLTMRDIFHVLLGQNEIRDLADILVP
ncbi:PREDICTED: uncharacterized protein LOC107187027 isoform X2 [Dufourea novaeangliae]|uniref:uncharacterized protein LOC107187027 isoform X2 n=1 Tax=Dufourea novaeangliae TaxID=178035 RepID=UPI000767AE06|nr:PREDICTED: uncharacterized protein LOC107187027 isoform X2 [Dufourea novaeangliae]